jgi:uncharacterized protein YdhG (YjbR/CyaY superfamily)
MTAAARTKRTSSTTSGFSAEERAAMKARAEELKLEKGGKKKAAELEACLAKIAELPDHDRRLAERIHSIVTTVAPELEPKTYYGMPAYARDGKVLCFFQPASKFDVRYGTLGFEQPANLDEGTMWPTAYALTDLTEADATRIETLVRQAVG